MKIMRGILLILILVALPFTAFGLSDDFNKGYDDAFAGRPHNGTSEDYNNGYEEGLTDAIGSYIVSDAAKDGKIGTGSSDK